jgi:hypothetical protein
VARPTAVNPTIMGPASAKCSCPYLGTRIEERRRHPGGGIDTRQIRSFIAIAFETRECKVEVGGGATVFAGNNMVNLMGQGHIVLM